MLWDPSNTRDDNKKFQDGVRIFTQREVYCKRERSFHEKGLLTALLVQLFQSLESDSRKRVNLLPWKHVARVSTSLLKEPIMPDVYEEIERSGKQITLERFSFVAFAIFPLYVLISYLSRLIL